MNEPMTNERFLGMTDEERSIYRAKHEQYSAEIRADKRAKTEQHWAEIRTDALEADIWAWLRPLADDIRAGRQATDIEAIRERYFPDVEAAVIFMSMYDEDPDVLLYRHTCVRALRDAGELPLWFCPHVP